MGGAPMQSVKNTLQLFLRSLPSQCHFNIIAFSTGYNELFAEVKPLACVRELSTK